MTRNSLPIADLEERALALRRRVVQMIERIGVGYLQQGLGAADIFAALYFGELRLREDDPDWPARDRCILSTAHNTALFYATFAERGLIDPALLDGYTQDGSPLEVNASERLGSLVEATCGSLGQGLSVAVGMALSLRRKGLPSRIYVVLGDGELQEGQVWEAALSAGGHSLGNLVMIVDRNAMQVEGHTDKVVRMDPIGAKFAAFGWNATEIDGNSMAAIVEALDLARETPDKPTLIVAHTVAGAGVPFLEGQLRHVARITPDEAKRAMDALNGVTA
jgi:transketolase